jgi:hypothetical protein
MEKQLHSKRGTYIHGIIETDCMDITACITSNDSVAKARMPEQCHYKQVHLTAMNLLAMSITLENDDNTIICPTCKQ